MRALRRLRRVRNRLIGNLDAEWYAARGLSIGQRVHIGPGVRLDPDHCWLVKLEDDVTLAPHVTVLAHDASTKQHLGYAALGAVTIKARSFVGAYATILPGVTIGEDSIVGAGSLVTKDIPPRSLAVGSPAQVVSTLDVFLKRHQERLNRHPIYDETWTARAGVSMTRKKAMLRDITEAGGGYIE